MPRAEAQDVAEPARAGVRLRRAAGAFIFLVGYLLSPLTWWNDLLVNLPLAWALASVVSWLSPRLFAPALVVAYWLTNLLGLLLMGLGGLHAAGSRPTARARVYALVGSLAYTLAMVGLVWLGLLKPLPVFWRHSPSP
jgi:hypothetical protein